MKAAPPPRLFVYCRPDAGRALVLRQGPTKVWCTIGWDLRRDELAVGQWVKHTIYAERCDLSSDGRFFVYFALDGHWKSEAKGSWTAISLYPHLKAIRLWPQGDTWGGGGMFVTGRDRPTDELYGTDRRIGGSEVARTLRDGWTKTRDGYTKSLGGAGTLRRRHAGPQRYAIVDLDGTIALRPTWVWAELDAPRERVLWAETSGVLYRAALGRRGLGEPEVVFDTRGMTFEAIAAPYASPSNKIR